MNRSFLILSCFVFLVVNVLSAQKLITSPEINARIDEAYSIAGEFSGTTVLVRDQQDEMFFQTFDSDLKPVIKNQQLELEDKKADLVTVINKRDHFVAFYTYRKKGRLHLKAHSYNGALELIDSATVFIYPKLIFNQTLLYQVSENEQTILFFDPRSNRDVEVIAFDLNAMETRFNRTIRPANLDYRRDVEQLLVTDEGHIFIVEIKNNRRVNRKNARFSIYHYDPIQDREQDISIPFKTNLYYDSYFAFDEQNKRLIAGGLYVEKRYDLAVGTFYLSIDPEHPAGHTAVFTKFPEEVISEAGQRKSKGGLTNVKVRKPVLRKDGGLILPIEEYRVVTRYDNRPGRAGINAPTIADNRHVDFYVNDVILLSIHPNGKTHWSTVLRKRQNSQNDDARYSSFFLATTRSGLDLIYNDVVDLETTIYAYRISSKGLAVRESLLNTGDYDVLLNIRDAQQISAKSILLASEKKRKIRVSKLIFE